jgi:hypothetical protein
MLKNATLPVLLLILGLSCKTAQPAFQPNGTPVTQIRIPRVDMMPNLPKPYHLKDWQKTALDFDRYVYDFNAKGDYRPFIWMDSTNRNGGGPTFGLYTATGDVRNGPKINHGENHEALGALGSILGATIAGIDKSNQDGRDYVAMTRNYFNSDNGWNIIMNFTNKGAHVGGGYGNDYWYDVYNNVLFYAVANYYPKETAFPGILKTVADQFYKSDAVLGNNYSHSFFDFKTMTPGNNQIPAQEDVAAGYAFILYAAYQKFGDEKYLQAARHALDVLAGQHESRFYEALMPLGAYVGARLNAETGTSYDPGKFINWTFDGNATNREGWGVIVGNWGGYDVSGMVGSTVDRGGYGFAMNTFDLAWPLTAMLRYDQRYSRAVGKWLLNASNTARLFYPYDIPDSLQAIPEKKALSRNAIAYEGLIHNSEYAKRKGSTPIAQGDGPQWAPKNPPESMFSLYGSGHVGIYGGIIQATNVERILQIDCRAMDMYRKYEAYPTYLYYNPYPDSKSVAIDLGKKPTDVYDAVHRTFLKRNGEGVQMFDIKPDDSQLLILIPSGAKYTVAGGRLMAGKVPVDFRYGQAGK